MSYDEYKQMLQRLSVVLSIVLDYCYVMLKWSETNLPKEFAPSADSVNGTNTAYGNNARDYVAVLYNDETHTYENVIYALVKSINCNKKVATDYATTVDRDGRAIIYYGELEKCKQIVEHISEITGKNSDRVLEVKVLCVYLVAHQNFSTRLLNWIRELLAVSEEFRYCFADYLYNPGQPSKVIQYEDQFEYISLLEKVMKSDVEFWKSIRIIWHQLFMSGLLLDFEIKKHFSRLFARNYDVLLFDFVHDDHEHHLSISGLSVQILTVPSLSRMLIEEENLLEVVLNTFLNLTVEYHKTGVFRFQYNTQKFRRLSIILNDVKFILTKPLESFVWTEKLRANFMNGAKAFVKLLKRIQTMDAVTRQVSQHIEYEPAWENGINLQMRIASTVKVFINFVITDRQVFCDTLNYALKMYRNSFENYCKSQKNPMCFSVTVLKHVLNHSAFVWEYDVSRKEVSIHLPLSRLVAALMLYLPKFSISYNQLNLIELPPFRLPPESLFELPLRTQVLVAQFRAGMWRRNGYSLMNQVIFYQNVRLREEMYDRDILSLQIGASIMDPNEFLIHLLNKFNLLFLLEDNEEKAPKPNTDEKVRQTITLIEEFLRLIYVIIAERYVPELGNVSSEECIRHEVIHWLCKSSMSNSELISQLSTDLEDDLEHVFLSVADFCKPPPGANTHGKYVLHERLHVEFNPLFYHYSRQEQSAAYDNELKRKKRLNETYICCPPPPLPDFLPPYESITDLLTCDLGIAIVRTILSKTCNLKDNMFSDLQFQYALYLIGLALNEESKRLNDFQFTNKSIGSGIVELLEKCNTCHYILPRIEMHKDLLNWVLDRFKQLLLSKSSSCPEVIQTNEAQKKEESEEKVKRREMAAARKIRVMEQIKAMQRSFMKENSTYFEECKDSSNLDKDSDGSNQNSLMEISSDSKSGIEPVAVGISQCRVQSPLSYSEDYICILCLEKYDMKLDGSKEYENRFLLLSAFVQNSTVLSQNRSSDKSSYMNACFVSADHKVGLYINTCTHYMHNDCFEKFFDTTALTEQRRSTNRYARISFDVTKQEFLCPLCECLCNIVIPVTPNLNKKIRSSSVKVDIPLDRWIQGMYLILQDCNLAWLLEVSSRLCMY